MKNFMLKNATQTLMRSTSLALKRFPIPSLLSLLFCIVSISKWPEHGITGTYLAILFCGCFWFIALKLFAEARDWHSNRYYAIGTSVFLVMSWYLYTSPDIALPFGFLGAGLFLSIFIAPFFSNHSSSIQVWEFNYRLWIRIFFTVLAAIILYLGLTAIIASLDFLFGVKFYGNIYGDIWLVIATLFSPILTMAGIPTRFDVEETNYPKAIQVILSYIALPLLCVYMVILYGYAAKILITWDLPKGGVAYLVSAFGCAGIVAYLASYPLHKSQGIIGLFSRHFFKILLLPLLLLAVSIGVRIHEYGVTEERYAILLCLIWLTLSAFFIITRRSEQSPKFVFFSVVALLIAASFGPWGAVNVSARSQLARLQNILEKNHVLVDGKIQISPQVLSHADRIAISSITDYIVNTKKETRIKPWFDTVPNAHIARKSEYLSAQEILQDMGIGYVESYNRRGEEDAKPQYHFTFDGNWKNQAYLNISGYDYFVNVGYYSASQTNSTKDIALDNGAIKLAVKLEPSSSNYVVKLGDTNEEVVFGLEDLIKKLDTEKAKNHASDQNLFMQKESSKLTIRLIINSVNGEFETGNEKPMVSSIDTTLLIKKK